MKSLQIGAGLLVSSCVLFSPALAQKIPDYDLGGASKPKPDFSFRKENQYKRVHQSSLRFILQGEIDETEEFLLQFLERNPKDPETLYMLGILRGQQGNIDAAGELLSRSLEAGLPQGRLVAGPRLMFEPLRELKVVKDAFKAYEFRPVHGPLVGSCTDSAAKIWLRTANESDVAVRAISISDNAVVATSPVVRSLATEDFTVEVPLSGLKPSTGYRYEISIDGKWSDSGTIASESTWEFSTFARTGQATMFSLAFGGGAGYVPENERMWETIEATSPDLLVLLGDNVYIDDPESITMQQYTYQRRQSRPEWRRLSAKTPVFTIWDDHDFSTNDSWGGADIDVPFWKKDWVFPIYRQNWANPAYGFGDDQPGCWYKFSVGDVDFIMLDCRYYRTRPKGKTRSMLGEVQKQWMKEQLEASQGRIKVLCSSVPWDFRTKGDSLDTWNGYKEEHEEILSFIEEKEIEGVLLMSADRHRSDCWKIERPEGYGLYEFNSSRLTNQHVHPTMVKAGAIFSYNALQSFGLVTFDTTVADPTITYEVVNIEGEHVHDITVRLSELKRK